MNPDDVTATATAFGVGVAALFGLGGLVVGIMGLVQASRARTEAAMANSIAHEANELAKAANEVIRDQVERETERSDVAWEWRWDETIRSEYVIIQNIGKGLAKEVVAQFFFDGSTEANDYPMDVEGRATFKLEIPALADRRKFAAEAKLTSRPWMLATRSPTSTPFPLDKTARVRLRVVWTTPKGAVRIYDTDYSDVSLRDSLY